MQIKLERSDSDKTAKKADELTDDFVRNLLDKIEVMKDLRKKLIHERSTEMIKLRAFYDVRVTRLARDVVKYEESGKVLVGPKKFAMIKKDWKKTYVKPVETKVVEKPDPLLKEMSDFVKPFD